MDAALKVDGKRAAAKDLHRRMSELAAGLHCRGDGGFDVVHQPVGPHHGLLRLVHWRTHPNELPPGSAAVRALPGPASGSPNCAPLAAEYAPVFPVQHCGQSGSANSKASLPPAGRSLWIALPDRLRMK